MTKAPAPQTNSKHNVTTQKRHQDFNYTTIADRLRTVSLGNDSQLSCVIEPVYGILIFQLTKRAV